MKIEFEVKIVGRFRAYYLSETQNYALRWKWLGFKRWFWLVFIPLIPMALSPLNY